MSKYTNIKRFFKIALKKNKAFLYIAFSIMIINSGLDLIIPQITKSILDDAIINKNSGLLVKLILIYITISVILSVLNIILDYICSIMNKRVSIDLKVKLLKHLSKLSGYYYTNIKTGNIFSIVETDIFMVESFGADILFSLALDVITAFIALFFLIRMNLDLLLIVVVLQILLGLSQSKFTKIIALKTDKIREADGEICNTLQEYISNIMNVVISKSTFNFLHKYIKQEKKMVNKCVKLDMIISSNISISQVLSGLITISIYGYGGLKIINGKMSIGELIAFQQYTGMLIGPCMNIIRSNTRLQRSLVSIDRIFSILDEPITIKHDNKGISFGENFNNNIEFNNVSFSYDKEKILDDISLKFEHNKTTALVGSSGCGKSTIVNLLFRLWDIDTGKITLNGIDIKNYSLKSLRQNISIITQDLLLFDDSIFNNLTLGKKSISKEYVKDICKKVDMYEFINELPEGFDTIIGEKGVKLSGGQKQRVAIARALISNSNIIIFDEATSALDNISQKNILQNISDLLNNKTVIVIAHRLSTIKDADKIYVMNKGQILEEGSHDELLSNQSFYYSLLNDDKEQIALA